MLFQVRFEQKSCVFLHGWMMRLAVCVFDSMAYIHIRFPLNHRFVTGMTAVGGMLLLAQGTTTTSIIPDTPAHWMGAIATTSLSFVNIVGGFLISGKMLNLFRRAEDPNDFFELYAIPAAVLIGGLAGSYLLGAENFENVSGSVAIAAAICSIAASKCIVVVVCIVV